MSEHDLLNLLRSALARVEPERAHVASGLDLSSSLVDLGLNSLSITAMIGHVEQELGIVFPDEEIAPVFDVPGFVRLVQRHLPARG